MTNESCDKPAVMAFEVLKAAIIDGSAARLGRLALAGRRSIETPNYFAATSRGVVPHMTPDNVNKHFHAGGAYMALEDFIEQPQQATGTVRAPPIYNAPTSQLRPRKLHSFTAMPPSIVTVLGARRIPAVPAPMGNSNSSVSVFTSNGFQNVTTKDYHVAVDSLRPDIAVPLADLALGPITPTSKRALRMAERTDEWLKAYFTDLKTDTVLRPNGIATFAPVLPIAYSIQWEYLERLSEDLVPTNQISGLAIYDPDVVPDMLNDYTNLSPLPRLSLSTPSTPQQILRQISLGLDIFVLPFINAVSDSGIAMTFTFPPPPDEPPLRDDGTRNLPLGIDLSSDTYKTSLTPLSPGCTCYACTSHHSAYIHHLLSAREMLGWTLLQTHNHAVMSSFFTSVRATLAAGQTAFDDAVRSFARAYDTEFPAGTGERPRARGYQFKTEQGAKKMNPKPWNKWDDEKIATAREAGKAAKLEKKMAKGTQQADGLETPLVPQDGADELDHKGFAKKVSLDDSVDK
ncbi:tRNA-guanine(15) transglycosylase-like protein [Podospora aff. communis PSN243]|uniref:Queuine tRNA-ribosyltransferase accessory subunit 2 n=1 Tax=Podospora aff. communis PSN243 TaxID=3040156 RepID=A0AAV9H9K3_9PEZI|nr:tRNA-guanine(15) transglycosylase-like protein [Podospora aff. communis PSN243]